MKRRIICFTMLVIGLCFLINTANAALINPKLGLPRILSNTTGIYTYTGFDGFLSFTGTPLSITEDGVNQIDIGPSNGDQFFRANLYLDSSGGFVGGVIGADLAIVGAIDGGASGTLLTGEITNFGFLDAGSAALFDFTFTVTGGLLADAFGGIGAEGGNSIWATVSSFSGNWEVNHSGSDVTHKTAAVPIPGTVLLFGGGLVGLLAIRRRRK